MLSTENVIYFPRKPQQSFQFSKYLLNGDCKNKRNFSSLWKQNSTARIPFMFEWIKNFLPQRIRKSCIKLKLNSPLNEQICIVLTKKSDFVWAQYSLRVTETFSIKRESLYNLINCEIIEHEHSKCLRNPKSLSFREIECQKLKNTLRFYL